ncbi:MAG: TGS domain-containing protein, partial [Candidatus Izemoplasmatales bacterium]
MISIQFADGNIKSFAKGVSADAIALAISPSLRKRCLAAEVNGTLVDLSRPIEADAKVVLITDDSPVALDIIRHSSAHLMAQAIKIMYPKAQFGVGPNIEEGFYYDIDLGDTVLTDSDLPEIEKVMAK